MGDIMPPKEVAEYMYALEDSINELMVKQPEEMVPVVKVSWYGEMYAALMEEGWTFIEPGQKLEGE